MDSCDLQEWQHLLGIATRPTVKLQISNIIASLESASNSQLGEQQGTKKIYTSVNSFSWDQTSKHITILIPISDEVTDVVISAESKSVEVKIEAGQKYYQLIVKNLYSSIDADNVSWKAKKGYVHVKLPKASEGHWSSLNAPKETKKPQPKPSSDGDPQHMLMDLMKNLYEEGDSDMKRTIAKAWTEAMDKRGDFSSLDSLKI